MKRLACSLLILVFASKVCAIDVPFRARKENGGFPGEWLMNHAVSARHIGLGNSGTALRGVAASFYNPAAILGRKYGEAGFLFAPLFSNGQSQAVSFSHSLSRSDALGLHILHLASGEAEKTDRVGQSMGSFKEQNLGFILSYGHGFFNGLLDTGTNIKFIRQSLDSKFGNAFGSDLGIQSHFFKNKLTIGFSFQNWIAPSIKLHNIKETYSKSFRGGFSYRCRWSKRRFLFVADTATHQSQWSSGLEFEPIPNMSLPLLLRFGINHREYSFGLGLSKDLFSLDYAATIHEIEILHRFGVSIKYGLTASLTEEQYATKLMEINQKESQLKILEKNIRILENRLDQNVKPVKKKHDTSPIQKKSPPITNETRQGQLDSSHTSNLSVSDLTKLAYIEIENENYLKAKRILLQSQRLDPSNIEVDKLIERINDILTLSSGGN